MIRHPLTAVGAILLIGLVSAFAGEKPGQPITAAAFGDRETNADQTCGDTWDSAWLAHGRVLVQYNDGDGFSAPHQNVHHDGLCELHGTPENLATIHGEDLNPGKLGSFLGQTYSTGLYELDGALYHFICRSIQIPGKWAFYDTCLYKSTDGGANWINERGEKNIYMPEQLATSTFPDERWGEVNFVKYGRGGEAPDIDLAHKYAYLSAGSYLARVRRDDLRAWTTTFDHTKIEYYCGLDSVDGESDAHWTHDIGRATSSVHSGRAPSTIVWNPGLKRYLSVSALGDSWQNPPLSCTCYLEEAPHPWGPWTEVAAEYIEPRVGDNLSWFYPMQPFMSADGLKMWLTISGRKPYGLQFIPLYLSTQPVITRMASDARLHGTQFASVIKGSLSPQYIGGFTKTGDGCTFAFSVKTAGTYGLSYRYYCDADNQGVNLLINGQPHGKLSIGNTLSAQYRGHLILDSTSPGQGPWTEGSARLTLASGQALIGFQLAPGDPAPSRFLLDRVQLVELPPGTPTGQ
jgi:hypothetical protein